MNLFKRSFSVSSISDRYDIIISGAGVIGSYCATHLASLKSLSRKKILLIDKIKPKPIIKNEPSVRITGLSPLSTHLFTESGVWSKLPNRACKAEKMQVWDSHSSSFVVFSDSINRDIATFVENDVILKSIFDNIQLQHNISTHYGEPLNDIYISESGPITVKIGNNEVATDLLIGTDGFNSQVRKLAKINWTTWTYDQLATTCLVEINSNINNIAFQKFLPTGPLAMLPISDKICQVIYFAPHIAAKILREKSCSDIINFLNSSFVAPPTKSNLTQLSEYIFPPIKGFQKPPQVVDIITKLASFPIHFGHASNYFLKPGIVLLGDAAHALHPLAGQGANCGFSDVRFLSLALETAIENGLPLTDNGILTKFETDSQRHNLPIQLMCEMFYRTSSTDFPLIAAARALATNVAAHSKFINSNMISWAST